MGRGVELTMCISGERDAHTEMESNVCVCVSQRDRDRQTDTCT